MKRSASLTFRGFAAHPEAVSIAMGRSPHLMLIEGEPVRPGKSVLAKRSAVAFELTFPLDEPLENLIPRLIEHLGGVENIQKVRAQIEPEFIEFDLTLDVRNSELVEDGAIHTSTMQNLVSLGATLGFSFPSACNEG